MRLLHKAKSALLWHCQASHDMTHFFFIFPKCCQFFQRHVEDVLNVYIPVMLLFFVGFRINRRRRKGISRRKFFIFFSICLFFLHWLKMIFFYELLFFRNLSAGFTGTPSRATTCAPLQTKLEIFVGPKLRFFFLR